MLDEVGPVGVPLGVAVGVLVGVPLGVAAGVFVGVRVAVAVAVCVGVPVGVTLAVLGGVTVGVRVIVAVETAPPPFPESLHPTSVRHATIASGVHDRYRTCIGPPSLR